MRKYNGYKIDKNNTCVGISVFVSFGCMADGSRVYHEVVNGEEVTTCYYYMIKYNNEKFFVFDGE